MFKNVISLSPNVPNVQSTKSYSNTSLFQVMAYRLFGTRTSQGTVQRSLIVNLMNRSKLPWYLNKYMNYLFQRINLKMSSVKYSSFSPDHNVLLFYFWPRNILRTSTSCVLVRGFFTRSVWTDLPWHICIYMTLNANDSRYRNTTMLWGVDLNNEIQWA